MVSRRLETLTARHQNIGVQVGDPWSHPLKQDSSRYVLCEVGPVYEQLKMYLCKKDACIDHVKRSDLENDLRGED